MGDDECASDGMSFGRFQAWGDGGETIGGCFYIFAEDTDQEGRLVCAAALAEGCADAAGVGSNAGRDEACGFC